MGIRCLIVDDSAKFLTVAQQLLTEQGVGVVGVAFDSSQALTQLDVLRPDVILVDVGLGDESGFDLAERIAGHNGSNGWPTETILISTRTEEDLRDLVEDSPAAGYLEKVALSAQAIRNLLAPRCR